jgi:DnaJ-class molecular chaperone
MDCPKCNGQGWVYIDYSCDVCSGSGQIDQDLIFEMKRDSYKESRRSKKARERNKL